MSHASNAVAKAAECVKVKAGEILARYGASAVFEMCRIDPEEYQGFAFGVGLERIAMLKYEIDDMHHLYENDIRFLKQF